MAKKHPALTPLEKEIRRLERRRDRNLAELKRRMPCIESIKKKIANDEELIAKLKA